MLNWAIELDNHKISIPADITYLSIRWAQKGFKSLLIIGTEKYNTLFNYMQTTTLANNIIAFLKHNSATPKQYDCILCYHSLSQFKLSETKAILKLLRKYLKPQGEVYLTLLSKDSYYYKNNEKADNQLYVNQHDLSSLLRDYKIINLEYTYRIKEDNKLNPHYYILAN